jgi:hypothetical protein
VFSPTPPLSLDEDNSSRFTPQSNLSSDKEFPWYFPEIIRFEIRLQIALQVNLSVSVQMPVDSSN